MQEFVGNLDESAELVCADGNLREGVIAFGDRTFLIDPGSGALGSHNGNLTIAGSGVDDMSQLTEDILLLKSLNEGMLKFIGDEVAAFGIGAFLQSVQHFGTDVLLTHGIPEALLVGFRLDAGLFVILGGRIAHGLAGERLADSSASISARRSMRWMSLVRVLISLSMPL